MKIILALALALTRYADRYIPTQQQPKTPPHCTVVVTHDVEGNCIKTTSAICCDGPLSCVETVTYECF